MTNSNAMMNRSLTVMNRPSEITNKPLYDLYTSPALQRKGSIKNLYNSSFGSMVSAGVSLKGKVKKLCSIFESPKEPPNLQSLQPSSPGPTKYTKLLLRPESKSFDDYIPSPVPDSPFRLPGTEDRVVIYSTSLRGIRRTFQDCHSIRLIFRGFRVNLDERDYSYLQRKYIGGAEVVKQLLEAGELVRLLKGLPMRPLKPCEACDDVRFFPCTGCNGSRKVFDEDEEQLKRCPECNENGLVRCPLCCL
ncbi:unnamed protein product [Fraxinus pennsylvanica]|uniref:Glutaredoxin family protein n=1 Tax=Fraxinus pennsylvanica TaxID=56036 RepID=A0AAD2DSX3_9LAMI|nr:unnamed protein product [Fraxinus pennsylvanica]